MLGTHLTHIGFLVEEEVRVILAGITFAGRDGDRVQVHAVDLRSLQYADVLEIGGGAHDRRHHVAQHGVVGLDLFLARPASDQLRLLVQSRLGDEVVERLVLVEVDDLGAVLAQDGSGCLGARAQRDPFDITEPARLGHELERRRLQLATMELRVDPDLRHCQTTLASASTCRMRSTAVPSSWTIAPALRASASASPSIVSPGSPRSTPSSPSPTCLISFERAAMIPFSDA